MWCQRKAKTISDLGQHPNEKLCEKLPTKVGRPTCEKDLSLCLWLNLHATILRYQGSHHLEDISVGTIYYQIAPIYIYIYHLFCWNATSHCSPGEAWGVGRSRPLQASQQNFNSETKETNRTLSTQSLAVEVNHVIWWCCCSIYLISLKCYITFNHTRYTGFSWNCMRHVREISRSLRSL